MTFDRRQLLQTTGRLLAGGTALALAARARAATSDVVLPFGNGERPVVAYPQKRPLIVQTTRPPQLETPFGVYDEGLLTPNDAFFVRYHLANIPLTIDPKAYRLEIKGLVKTPLSLALADLVKGFPATELVAVNQCSGNSRGFSSPRVAGGQSANGAMGNARWRGVPLKAVLAKAGVGAGAKQVTFRGLDGPVLPQTPTFIKALTIDHALDGEVLLAYAMNGVELPMLNGFPVRLVVPGYYGTYWVKHLSEITVLDHEFDGFFMAKAYRIPADPCACVPPLSTPKRTVPIARYDVRSFITNLKDGAKVPAGHPVALRGIAFDGGVGIREVALSPDGGKSWLPTTLGEDLGRYSFRAWHTAVTLPRRGRHDLLVRATSRDGATQPLEATWNPAGYMRNVVERTQVEAV